MKFFLVLLALFSSLTVAEEALDISSDYRLGSGDTIKIAVWNEPDLTLQTVLSDTGTFNYPFLGNIKALGLTIDELEAKIASGLSPDFLLKPDVNVLIINYRHFFIRGEVKKPGNYEFQPGLTLRKAIAIAGGLTERASKTKMFILSDSDPGGEEIPSKLEQKIKPGDIIYIKQSFF